MISWSMPGIAPQIFDQTAPTLSVKNRILAHVGPKVISVLDVQKQMDLFLVAHHPRAMESSVARYQFYKENWRTFFEKMVENTLILTDVGEKDFKIKESEVREMMVERFGNRLMHAIDQCGISYTEAQQLFREELTVQRMMWFKVEVKTWRLRPADLRNAYREYLEKHPQEQEWTYRVLSIRSPEVIFSAQLAHVACSLLRQAKSDLFSLITRLEEERSQYPGTTFHLSELLRANSRTISQAHRQGLEGLAPGEYSQPITQFSGDIPVQRIFFLEGQQTRPTPSFETIKARLEQEQRNLLTEREATAYRTKLRRQYGHWLQIEPLPPHFCPFSLEH
jgi:hypothetical protein